MEFSGSATGDRRFGRGGQFNKTALSKASPAVQVVQNGIDTEKYAAHHPISLDIRRELDIPAKSIVIGIALRLSRSKKAPLLDKSGQRIKGAA